MLIYLSLIDSITNSDYGLLNIKYKAALMEKCDLTITDEASAMYISAAVTYSDQ